MSGSCFSLRTWPSPPSPPQWMLGTSLPSPQVSGADLRTKGTLFKDNPDYNELSDDGSSLTLSGSAENLPLWSMPVQDASCFSDNGDYTISGKVDYSRVGGDNDILFGIHDGSSVIGISRLDNKGGMVQLRYGNKGTWDDGQAWGQSLAIKSLPINISDMTVMFDIAFSAGDDKGTFTVRNPSGASGTFSKSVDRLSFSSSISFFLAGHSGGEKYKVRSIEISAPCPARTKVHIQGPGNLHFF